MQTVQIKPPNFKTASFHIKGTSPLVIHRFSQKVKDSFQAKMETGKAAGSKKDRTAVTMEELFDAARYRSAAGWDGFNASAMRCAMISACRLVGFKMTLAKLSVVVLEDGRDATEPQIPLIRIIGKPILQKDIGRTETGVAMLIVRPAYHDWAADVRIRWDADQFTLEDISALLMRVGQQVGIGEGRNDSKNSCGMGWGSFEISEEKPKRK